MSVMQFCMAASKTRKISLLCLHSLLLITHVSYINKQIVGIVLFYMACFFLFYYFQRCANKRSKTARYVWRLYTKKLNLFSFQKVKIYTFVCIDCIHACTLVNVFTSFSRPAQKTVIILHKTASVDSYSIIHIQTKTLTFVRWTTLTPLCTNSVRSKQSITIHN